MADVMQLIDKKEWISFGENYQYKTSGYMGQSLFPTRKTENIKLAMRQIVEDGDLPVMAQVHALDSEARIGDRTNYKELELEKFFIKEKLNQGERLEYFKRDGGKEDGIIDFIFDDASSLVSRVITRTEVMNMELLATGKLTINENNVSIDVDYNLPEDNKVVFSSWSVAAHDIIGDIIQLQKVAKSHGKTLVRAITSDKIIGYMMNNTAIKAYWANKENPMTQKSMLSWILGNYGIEFISNDELYKTSANGTTKNRFFDEDTITFLSTRGTVGEGLFAPTPEELKLMANKVSNKMLVTITQWESEDPATTWTKASALYVPVIKDINGLFVAKVV